MATNAVTKKLDGDELARVEESLTAIEQVAEEFGLAGLAKASPMLRALRLSQGVQQLRELVTVDRVRFMFLPLMGSPLGFLTDKDAKPAAERYSAEEVRDVIVEALLRGFMPTGNEFNIISGRFYAAKAGLERQVLEFPGVTRLELTPGVPVMSPGGALVPYHASWIYQGEVMQIVCEQRGESDTRIPVKVNAGMGPDAILGKAERKIYWRILKRLLGNAGTLIGPEGEPELINTSATPAPLPPEQDGRRMRLGKSEPMREPGED